MNVSLNSFVKAVSHAKHDSRSEQIVRHTIAEVAMACPIELLVDLGECIIEFRRAEIRTDLEKN